MGTGLRVASRLAVSGVRVRPSALLAAAYLCFCARMGICEGWRILFGRLHHPGWRTMLEEPPCPDLVKLAERDPETLERIALAHYMLVRRGRN